MTEAVVRGKREATKQANRAAILDAAADVFSELGFGAASVRDIVRGTDLAAGTFYNYFPDKEAVFRALVEETVMALRPRVHAARRDATTLDEFIRAGFRVYFTYLAGDPQAAQLIRRNAGTMRLMFDDPMLVSGNDELEADLRAGIAAGLLPEHDTRLMTAAMVGAAFEVAQQILQTPGEPDIEGATDFVADLFLGGLDRLR